MFGGILILRFEVGGERKLLLLSPVSGRVLREQRGRLAGRGGQQGGRQAVQSQGQLSQSPLALVWRRGRPEPVTAERTANFRYSTVVKFKMAGPGALLALYLTCSGVMGIGGAGAGEGVSGTLLSAGDGTQLWGSCPGGCSGDGASQLSSSNTLG